MLVAARRSRLRYIKRKPADAPACVHVHGAPRPSDTPELTARKPTDRLIGHDDLLASEGLGARMAWGGSAGP